MSNAISAIRSGNWRSLLACFLYFDTGFTVWLLYGPLAPFISHDLHLNAAATGFLVAVPVLSAAILRIVLGNLYQSTGGRALALAGMALSAVPLVVIPLVPVSHALLLALGVLLGMGGASFAVALPMAGSTYPARVQGLVLGLAAAGNIGAVLDGFLFPPLASRFGWPQALMAALPLLGIAALTMGFFGEDRLPKTGSRGRALAAFVIVLAALPVLVVGAFEGWFGVTGKAAMLLLPVPAVLLTVSLLPARYREVLGSRDTWVVVLVYSITFGGFVGMSAYVTVLLIHLYGLGKLTAGLWMSALALTGALLRPLGGHVADRVTGVHALRWFLAGIALCDLLFAVWTPPIAFGLPVLFVLYASFGLGNGATFQLVPQRWPHQTGIMTGLVGAAGGLGGFYLPVLFGIAKDMTGRYAAGFAFFGTLATVALVIVMALVPEWVRWARPANATA